MGAHLRAEAEMQPPARRALDVPGGAGHREGAAREGNGDIGAEFELLGGRGRDRERQERVLRRLEGPGGVEAELLQALRLRGNLAEVETA